MLLLAYVAWCAVRARAGGLSMAGAVEGTELAECFCTAKRQVVLRV